VDWGYVYVTLEWSLPALSLAFLGMAAVRHLQVPGPRSHLVRHSLLVYAAHPIPIVIAIVLDSHLGRQAGVIFAVAMFGCSALLLLACICYGLKSGLPAGRRSALAGLCMIGAFFAGSFYLLSPLMGKMVA
jgi:hypothetical protein